MGELLPLLAMLFFVAVILGIYHLQQRDLDRLSRQIEDIVARYGSGQH